MRRASLLSDIADMTRQHRRRHHGGKLWRKIGKIEKGSMKSLNIELYSILHTDPEVELRHWRKGRISSQGST